MRNITNDFGSLYHPQKAFVVFQQASGNQCVYVEAYDFDADGYPVNAHPLSVREGHALSKALRISEKQERAFLAVSGLMPKNVLHIRTANDPFAVWHTPAQNIRLLFRDDLGIPCGICHIPQLVWKAGRKGIAVYAVTAEQLTPDTPLLHAPFFNTYEDGHVCMGNVSISIPANCCLEDFMALWERAFFDSYFSHMVAGHNPVRGNMVQLWKSLSGTGKQFPEKVLTCMNKNLKHLIA